LRKAPGGPLTAHLRKLGLETALYGTADVLPGLLNFLLVPVYARFLGPADYGALALLLLFSTLAKVVFRLGLDAGFFRTHYDLGDEAERRRLAGTVALAAAGVAGVFLAAVTLSAPALTGLLFLGPRPPSVWVVLVAADVFLGALTFVPASLLRIQGRAGLFSALSVGRHVVNTALKVALVARGGGVGGVLWSDVLATGLYALALLPVLVRHATPTVALALVRPALAFGLPKVPHGLLLQLQNLADRKILDLFVSRAELGVYQMGYTFGQGVKFATSAFEPAWGPFLYGRLREKDAPATIARMATVAFTAFTAVALAVAVLGGDLVRLMTPPPFWGAAQIVPVVALAYLLHGAFLLTSVGIGIDRKARYYPLITAVSAAVNLAANFALVPTWGGPGAAWATVLSYAAMAALGLAISRRLYPIPFPASRWVGVGAVALLVYAASLLLPPSGTAALALRAVLVAGGGLFLWRMGAGEGPRGSLGRG
jgi:O-antigen/teichoic acid export membrane protein